MEIVLILCLVFSFGFATYQYGRSVERNEQFKQKEEIIKKLADAHNRLNNDEFIKRLREEFKR